MQAGTRCWLVVETTLGDGFCNGCETCQLGQGSDLDWVMTRARKGCVNALFRAIFSGLKPHCPEGNPQQWLLSSSGATAAKKPLFSKSLLYILPRDVSVLLQGCFGSSSCITMRELDFLLNLQKLGVQLIVILV